SFHGKFNAGGTHRLKGRRAFSADLDSSSGDMWRGHVPHRPLPRLQSNSGLPEFDRFIDWPKSETSDFGWRDRVGACSMTEHFRSPPPQPSPASGGGRRPSMSLALDPHHTEIRLNSPARC